MLGTLRGWFRKLKLGEKYSNMENSYFYLITQGKIVVSKMILAYLYL